jgi:coenzyme F420 hydrogenase subunit beta
MNNGIKDFNLLHETVISNGLCARCGLCSGVCPAGAISLDADAFPQLTGKCEKCGFCVNSCPGGEVDFPELSRRIFNKAYNPEDIVGHVDNIYVSHPTDQKIRMAGASGGLTTGLLVYLLEKKEIDGAVVVDMDSEKGYLTKGIIATTAQEIRDAAQSKYCVTPSLEVLRTIRKTKGRFAVVALPCQIHGLRKLERVDPSLSKKIKYYFGLFCNCNLEINSHIEAMLACSVNLDDVEKFYFRGGGWPGGFHIRKKDGSEQSLHTINIKNVMNVMFRILGAQRCYLCYDALAEYADLSMGDFWAFDYAPDWSDHERCTLVYQRTARGEKVLNMALADGAVTMDKLPVAHNSKRILKMAKGKKNRAVARLYAREKKGVVNPNYFFTIPQPGKKARLSILLYNLFQLFRGALLRKLVLKILFSPAGVFFDKLNVIRKNKFSDYHDN